MRFQLSSSAPVTRLAIRLGSSVLTVESSDLRVLRAAAVMPTATGPQGLTLEAWGACFDPTFPREAHDRTSISRIVSIAP